MRKLLPVLFLAFAFILMSCGSGIKLPDLEGQTEASAIKTLEDLDFAVTVEYIEASNVENGYFVSYKAYETGDKAEPSTTIVINIAQNGYELPDLAAATETETIAILDNLGVSYEISYEHNYNLTDYTFSRYDTYEVGDVVPADQTVQVYITWNGSFLPELDGFVKTEIIASLDYEFISNYEFAYIIDDTKEEDTFAGYEGFVAGDPAVEQGTITVNLYKNSFTDAATSLFFSKYLEGDDNNDRAVEIYNPTDVAIDLSEYHISIFQNGSFDETYRIELTGTIQPQSSYTIAYKGSRQALLDVADQKSTRLIYDGNDTIQLRYSNETYIDTIYDLGNVLFVSEDELLIRKENTVKGSRDFSLNGWQAFMPNYFESFGTFPVEIPDTLEINQEYLSHPFGLDTVSGMIQVTLVTINDGDTAGFTPGFTNDKRVRFLGVDTPETYPTQDPWGPEAKEYTTGVLNGGSVIYLQSDPYLGATGNYGRTLAYIWVDGTMLNYELIRHGFSFNYLSKDSKLEFNHRYLYQWFAEAEQYAKDNQLGIHS